MPDSSEYAFSRMDVTTIGLQCPECGTPVDVMEARHIPAQRDDLTDLGSVLVRMEPCCHELPSDKLEHSFGIA